MRDRRSKSQLELDVAPRQRRLRRSEDDRFHAAVLELRKAGHRVYRAGKDVLIDGDRRSSRFVLDAVRRPDR